jgi:protein associated with RNAse G/E
MLAAVEVYKMLPNGSQWGYWQGYRLPVMPTCPMIWTPTGTLMHWHYNTWETHAHEITFIWPSRWYVIHAFYTPEHQFFGCYCDIVMPNALLSDAACEVRYTDLYIDVVVDPQHGVITKDEEIYERAMHVNPQLIDVRDQAFAELDALATHARNWTGPFIPIKEKIVRTDWHLLDPTSSDFSAACLEQWGDYHPED